MIFGAKEEIIPKYYDDDKPKSVQKTALGLVWIMLLWSTKALAPHKIGFPFAVIAVVTINGKGKDDAGNAAAGSAELGVCSKATHDGTSVQTHYFLSFL